jgi:FAD synthase
MEIDFIEYIRGESRFSSKEALAQQIAKDAQYAHNVLKV